MCQGLDSFSTDVCASDSQRMCDKARDIAVTLKKNFKNSVVKYIITFLERLTGMGIQIFRNLGQYDRSISKMGCIQGYCVQNLLTKILEKKLFPNRVKTVRNHPRTIKHLKTISRPYRRWTYQSCMILQTFSGFLTNSNLDVSRRVMHS